MDIYDMRRTIWTAEKTVKDADDVVAMMAKIIAGRLRNGGVVNSVLCKLKKELADYNMHTGTWRDQ